MKDEKWCVARQWSGPDFFAEDECEFTTDCGHRFFHNNEENPYKYCPYCGKLFAIDDCQEYEYEEVGDD